MKRLITITIDAPVTSCASEYQRCEHFKEGESRCALFRQPVKDGRRLSRCRLAEHDAMRGSAAESAFSHAMVELLKAEREAIRFQRGGETAVEALSRRLREVERELAARGLTVGKPAHDGPVPGEVG